MNLTKAAILALRGLTLDQKQQLADLLGVSLKTLYRHIASNNDDLTKAAALQFLRGVTGLPDGELLEDTGDISEVKEQQM